jgi:hypothetical protein
VGREDLAGVEGDDRDLLLVDDRQDPPARMGRADLEVVEAARPAQGDGALDVGDVVAEAEVGPGRVGAGGLRPGRRPVRLPGRDPADRPVRPPLVVGEAEGVELGLKLAQGPCCRLTREPAFQGLVEALDLALGLGMPGRPVLLPDAEVGEQVLEPVATTGEPGRVDGAVVSERRGRPAVLLASRDERGHHVVAGDPPEGGDGEQEAGVVVEPADDLDLGAVGQAPVGEVRLPQLVGCRGLEADPRAPRALARLGRHEPRRVEDAPDGRGGRRLQALALEVPGDRDRARVQAGRDELGPQPDDPRPDGVRRSGGVRQRSAGARLEGLEPAVPVPVQEPVQVPAAHAALGRGGSDGQLPGDDLEDGHPVLRHASDCRACPDSPVAYQLSPMS